MLKENREQDFSVTIKELMFYPLSPGVGLFRIIDEAPTDKIEVIHMLAA
jgi:hypothetical protein